MGPNSCTPTVGVQVFGPRLGVVFGSQNGVADGVEIGVAARILVCCRHSALMLVLSCVGNVILFPARCRLAWPALFVDAALVSGAVLIRLRLGTIAMRPLCQLCEGHRPGRRYRCRRCEYLVGPGCVPQNCSFAQAMMHAFAKGVPPLCFEHVFALSSMSNCNVRQHANW